MRTRSIRLSLTTALAATALAGNALGATTFTVNPDVGNNAFTAVFDAAVGERISAVSSAIGCTLSVDEARLEGRATCSVPLSAIRVDNDDTKTEHFREWATNKAMEAAKCTLDVEVPAVKLAPPIEAKKPVTFAAEGTFTICGRKRDDGRPERIQGTVIDLPAGSYGEKRTLRIRARIEKFDREKYGVSPKNTPGWLARVQQLAPVVAAEGTIDVNVFATTPDGGEGDAKP